MLLRNPWKGETLRINRPAAVKAASLGTHFALGFVTGCVRVFGSCAPFGVATLLDQDVEIDFSSQTTPNDVVTVIATQPLTGNETWQKIMPGEWRLFCLGERVV